EPVALGEGGVRRASVLGDEVVLLVETPLDLARSADEASAEALDGVGHDLPREGAVEAALRLLGAPVGDGRRGVERDRRLATHALVAAGGAAEVAAEVAEEALHVVPEAPALGRVAREHVALEEPDEELLREVVRFVLVARPGGARVVADGRPVAAAELLHERAVLARAGPELPQDAPGRLGELHARLLARGELTRIRDGRRDPRRAAHNLSRKGEESMKTATVVVLGALTVSAVSGVSFLLLAGDGATSGHAAATASAAARAASGPSPGRIEPR